MTIIGTKVRLARDIDRTHPCCDNVAIIAPTTALHCATCNSFRGWASKAMVDFINTTARRFGAPAEPIIWRQQEADMAKEGHGVRVVHLGPQPHRPDRHRPHQLGAVSMNRQQHIDMIRHLIEVEGFVPKDFFLTAPRAKDRARERERHRIAHIMKQCGLTTHDLSPPKVSELPAVDGADSGRNASAPRKRLKNG
jgi:hypothetical protein